MFVFNAVYCPRTYLDMGPNFNFKIILADCIDAKKNDTYGTLKLVEAMTTMKRRYPDGIVLEPVQILEKGINDGSPPTAASTSPESIDNLFITMVRSHE